MSARTPCRLRDSTEVPWAPLPPGSESRRFPSRGPWASRVTSLCPHLSAWVMTVPADGAVSEVMEVRFTEQGLHRGGRVVLCSNAVTVPPRVAFPGPELCG